MTDLYNEPLERSNYLRGNETTYELDFRTPEGLASLREWAIMTEECKNPRNFGPFILSHAQNGIVVVTPNVWEFLMERKYDPDNREVLLDGNLFYVDPFPQSDYILLIDPTSNYRDVYIPVKL